MERTMRTIAVVLALAARASTAAAQQDFSSIKLKAGQHARATEDGITLSGEVTAVAPDAIVIDGHRLQPGPGLKIERDRGHTGWKGMGIGGAIGAIGGITIVSGAF